jgi:hypothetical protein
LTKFSHVCAKASILPIGFYHHGHHRVEISFEVKFTSLELSEMVAMFAIKVKGLSLAAPSTTLVGATFSF